MKKEVKKIEVQEGHVAEDYARPGKLHADAVRVRLSRVGRAESKAQGNDAGFCVGSFYEVEISVIDSEYTSVSDVVSALEKAGFKLIIESRYSLIVWKAGFRAPRGFVKVGEL